MVNMRFFLNHHGWTLKMKADNIIEKFLHWQLYFRASDIYALATGSCQKGLNQKEFTQMMVYIPPLPIQQEIVESLDLIYNNAATAKAAAASIKSQMAAIMRSVGLRGYEKKKLGDVCEDISTGKNIPSSERVDGEFKFFTCSRDYSTHNQYHYDGTYIIHGSRGSTIDESVFLAENEKFAIGTSMFLSKVKKEDELHPRFLYYHFKFNRQIVNTHVNTTAIPMITKTKYYTIEVPIPPFAIQQEVLAILNEMEAELKAMEQMAAKAEQRAKYVLDGYLSSQPVEATVQQVLEPDVAPQNTLVSASESEPAEAPTPPPKPAKKVIKLKKSPPVHDT